MEVIRKGGHLSWLEAVHSVMIPVQEVLEVSSDACQFPLLECIIKYALAQLKYHGS